MSGTMRCDRHAGGAAPGQVLAWSGGPGEARGDSVYREVRPAADLAEYVLCVWHRRIGHAEGARPTRILPDGCMDLLWMDGSLLVAGPDRTAWVGHLPAGTEIAGLRFRPGAAAAVLGVPASELVGHRLPAAAVWERAVAPWARLKEAESPTAASVLLQDAVRQQLVEAPPPDALVQAVVRAVYAAGGDAPLRVGNLAERLGVSERQLHRRCHAALGYGPKTFARIARFQQFVAQARQAAPGSLAHLAARAGYADQPHLTREVGRLAGVPPAELLAELSWRSGDRTPTAGSSTD